MAISTADRIAALEIACRAERDCVERAEQSGNSIAVALNRQRLDAAQKCLSAAIAAMNSRSKKRTVRFTAELCKCSRR